MNESEEAEVEQIVQQPQPEPIYGGTIDSASSFPESSSSSGPQLISYQMPVSSALASRGLNVDETVTVIIDRMRTTADLLRDFEYVTGSANTMPVFKQLRAETEDFYRNVVDMRETPAEASSLQIMLPDIIAESSALTNVALAELKGYIGNYQYAYYLPPSASPDLDISAILQENVDIVGKIRDDLTSVMEGYLQGDLDMSDKMEEVKQKLKPKTTTLRSVTIPFSNGQRMYIPDYEALKEMRSSIIDYTKNINVFNKLNQKATMFGGDSVAIGRRALNALYFYDLGSVPPSQVGSSLDDLRAFKNNLMTQVLFAQKLPDDADYEVQIDIEKDFLGTGLSERSKYVFDYYQDITKGNDYEKRVVETYKHVVGQLKYLVPIGRQGYVLATLLYTPEAMTNFERATYAETTLGYIDLYYYLVAQYPGLKEIEKALFSDYPSIIGILNPASNSYNYLAEKATVKVRQPVRGSYLRVLEDHDFSSALDTHKIKLYLFTDDNAFDDRSWTNITKALGIEAARETPGGVSRKRATQLINEVRRTESIEEEIKVVEQVNKKIGLSAPNYTEYYRRRLWRQDQGRQKLSYLIDFANTDNYQPVVTYADVYVMSDFLASDATRDRGPNVEGEYLGKPSYFVVASGGSNNQYWQYEEEKYAPTVKVLANYADSLQQQDYQVSEIVQSARFQSMDEQYKEYLANVGISSLNRVQNDLRELYRQNALKIDNYNHQTLMKTLATPASDVYHYQDLLKLYVKSGELVTSLQDVRNLDYNLQQINEYNKLGINLIEYGRKFLGYQYQTVAEKEQEYYTIQEYIAEQYQIFYNLYSETDYLTQLLSFKSVPDDKRADFINKRSYLLTYIKQNYASTFSEETKQELDSAIYSTEINIPLANVVSFQYDYLRKSKEQFDELVGYGRWLESMVETTRETEQKRKDIIQDIRPVLGYLNAGLRRLGVVTDSSQITYDPSYFEYDAVKSHYDSLFAYSYVNLYKLYQNVQGIENETQVVAQSVAEYSRLRNTALGQLYNFLYFVHNNFDKFSSDYQGKMREIYYLLLDKQFSGYEINDSELNIIKGVTNDMATKFATNREMTSDERNLIGSATKILEELVATTYSSVAQNKTIIMKNRSFLTMLQSSGLPLANILPPRDDGQPVTDLSYVLDAYLADPNYMNYVFKASIGADNKLKEDTNTLRTVDSILRTQLKVLSERQGKVEYVTEYAQYKQTYFDEYLRLIISTTKDEKAKETLETVYYSKTKEQVREAIVYLANRNESLKTEVLQGDIISEKIKYETRAIDKTIEEVEKNKSRYYALLAKKEYREKDLVSIQLAEARTKERIKELDERYRLIAAKDYSVGKEVYEKLGLSFYGDMLQNIYNIDLARRYLIGKAGSNLNTNAIANFNRLVDSKLDGSIENFIAKYYGLAAVGFDPMTDRMKAHSTRYKSTMNSLMDNIYANASVLLSERYEDGDYDEYINRTNYAYENLVNATTQMSSLASVGSQMYKYDYTFAWLTTTSEIARTDLDLVNGAKSGYKLNTILTDIDNNMQNLSMLFNNPMKPPSNAEVNSILTRLYNNISKTQETLDNVRDRSLAIKLESEVRGTVNFRINQVMRQLYYSGYLDQRFHIRESDSLKNMEKSINKVMDALYLYAFEGKKVGADLAEQGLTEVLKDMERNNFSVSKEVRDITDATIRSLVDNFGNFREDLLDRMSKSIDERIVPIFKDVQSEKLAQLLKNTNEAREFFRRSNQVPFKVSAEADTAQIGRTLNMYRGEMGDISERFKSYVEARPEANPLLTDPAARKKFVREAQNQRFRVTAGYRTLTLPFEDDRQLRIASIANYQKEISALPKDYLKEKERELEQYKYQYQQLLNRYDINVLDDDDQRRLNESTKQMLSAIAYYYMPAAAQEMGRNPDDIVSSRIAFDFSKPLAENYWYSTIYFANDFLGMKNYIVGVALAPIHAKLKEGLRPSRDDIIKMKALENASDYILSIANANIDRINKKELNATELPYELELKLPQLTVEIARTRPAMDEFMRDEINTVMQVGIANIYENLAGLDELRKYVKERVSGESDIDRFERMNKYMTDMQSNIYGSMMKTLNNKGLAAFAYEDPYTREFMRNAARNATPMFFKSRDPNRQPFMAFADSYAVREDNPKLDRINDAAFSYLGKDARFSMSDLQLLRNVKMERGELLIKEEKKEGGSGEYWRSPTRDEKRKIVKLLVMLMLSVYYQTVRSFTKYQLVEQQAKLYSKYETGDEYGRLIEMINKLVDKAMQGSEYQPYQTTY